MNTKNIDSTYPIRITKYSTISKAIKEDIDWLLFANRRLRGNYKLAIESVKQNGFSIFYFNTNIVDKRLVVESIKTNPEVFEYLPFKYKNNKNIVWLASKLSYSNFKHSSERIKNDLEFCSKMVKLDPYFVLNVNRKLWENSLIKNEVVKEKTLKFLFNQYFSLHGGKNKEDSSSNEIIDNQSKTTSTLSEQLTELKNEVSEYDNEVSKFNDTYGNKTSNNNKNKSKNK